MASIIHSDQPVILIPVSVQESADQEETEPTLTDMPGDIEDVLAGGRGGEGGGGGSGGGAGLESQKEEEGLDEQDEVEPVPETIR